MRLVLLIVSCVESDGSATAQASVNRSLRNSARVMEAS